MAVVPPGLPWGERVEGDMVDRVSHPVGAAFCLRRALQLAGRSSLGHSWVSQPFWQQSVWGLLFPYGREVAAHTLWQHTALPAGPVPIGTEGFTSGASRGRAGSGCMHGLMQPRLKGQEAVFSLLLLANTIHFPDCPVFLSQHQGVLAEGGWEDVRVLIWQAGTECFENQFCLRKAQGSQYFPTGTCLSPSPCSG